jgi:hypothetical protein
MEHNCANHTLIDTARLAQHYQTKPDTTANVFHITDGAETVTVELDELRNPPCPIFML